MLSSRRSRHNPWRRSRYNPFGISLAAVFFLVGIALLVVDTAYPTTNVAAIMWAMFLAAAITMMASVGNASERLRGLYDYAEMSLYALIGVVAIAMLIVKHFML